MNNKFLFLTKMSLKKKMGSKWFKIANVLLAVAIIALMNINSIITFFGGDFDHETKVYVIEKDTAALQTKVTFEENMKSLLAVSKGEDDEEDNIVVSSTSKTEKEMTKSLGKDEVLIVLETDDTNFLKAKVISKDKIDTMTYQFISQSLNATKAAVALTKLQIDPATLASVSSAISIDRVVLDEAKSVDENMSMIMGTVFPTIILPFFMLIIFLVQMVGGEICEEKTTKSMEIIISNVSPKTHLLSKVLASNIFVISQGLLLFLYALIGFFISTRGGGFALPTEITSIWSNLVETGFFNNLVYLIPLTLILMVLSFLAYSLIAGILASMTTNMEDFQQIQTPIMLVLLAGYYLSMMAGMFEGSLFIKILSYIPFLSCLISPSLFMMGQISIIDVLISIVILIFFIFVLFKYGLRIYKIGILNYSNEKVWSRLAKAVKTKDV